MHHVFKPVIAFLLLGIAIVGPASAAPAPKYDALALKKDAETCHGSNDDPEARIAACTRVIDSRRPPPRRSFDVFDRPAERLAEIFESRSSAYSRKGDYAAAIRDYREALKLAPTRVDFRRRLAVVYQLADDKEGQLREYEAILGLISESNSDFTYYRQQRDRLKEELSRRQTAAASAPPPAPVSPPVEAVAYLVGTTGTRCSPKQRPISWAD